MPFVSGSGPSNVQRVFVVADFCVGVSLLREELEGGVPDGLTVATGDAELLGVGDGPALVLDAAYSDEVDHAFQ